MSKIRQRTQPLSCSRHKRDGCRAKAQAALPTMMSGLDGCLRADVTWVGSGQKEGESFHVRFSAAECWRGTVAEQGSAWSASILYTTYILPILQHACIAVTPFPYTAVDRLECLQRKAVKVCLHLPIYSHIDHYSLLHSIHWARIFSRLKINHTIFLHWIHNMYASSHILGIAL